ncbi:MAG TPA: hypothetical protein VJ723_01985 [Candidatus Angelobacter sp.]|nr:hypothetical protein [Candidatus Angelobacter sp.]
MARPVGVTILAILDFLGAAGLIVAGIVSIVSAGTIATFLHQNAQTQDAQAAGGVVAFILGALTIFLFIGAVISLLLGWGLWKLKNWARIITIILEVIWLLFCLLGLLGLFAHFTIGGLIWTLFWIAIPCLIIWYLLKADVKAAFK